MSAMLLEKYRDIQSRLARHHTVRGAAPRLIGVSKKQPLEKVLALAQAGLRDFGENYVQDWQKKLLGLKNQAPDLAPKLAWHFIGHLQTNKVKEVVGRADVIHTVDSLRLAQKISQRATQLTITQHCLLEINLGNEANKFGWTPEELKKNLPALAQLPGIHWEGLMAIPPVGENAESSRPFFRALKSLLDECNQSGDLTPPMTELSMGMSLDYEVAIEEGATMVRIGTALFGPRE